MMSATVEDVAEVFNKDKHLFAVREITDDFIDNYSGTTVGYHYAKEKELKFF